MTAIGADDGPRVAAFRAAVLAWYAGNGRRLAFRGQTDPYRVLVSETILQQTQVTRGEPAWAAFVDRFPTVEVLAAASPADVLRAWRGLGYNRRALNLQRAARMVVDELDGRFPADVTGLERLPGVGPYTARAVAAIAYGIPVGAIDTNVRRVLGRAFGGEPFDPGDAGVQELADRLVPPDRAADWTHALMDLGSAVCRPRDPACPACPVQGQCRYAARPGGARRASRPVRAGPISRTTLPFVATNRWLRGRIVDRLREAPGTGWTEIHAPIGDHDAAAVEAVLVALARDGLIELEPADHPQRARLPVA